MTDSRIAVIGMAVRLPGAEDVADLRWLLTHDSVEVDEVPPSRWARDHYLGDGDHQGTHHRGAFLQDPFSFDHEAFGLTAGDAVLLDPQQRVMLEVGARALEDAGYRSVRRRLDAGVFVGARMNSYGFDHGRGLAPIGSDGTGRPVPAALWGRSQNFVAAWLSDRLDLTGPSLVVDTACSSSLTAVWLGLPEPRRRQLRDRAGRRRGPAARPADLRVAVPYRRALPGRAVPDLRRRGQRLRPRRGGRRSGAQADGHGGGRR